MLNRLCIAGFLLLLAGCMNSGHPLDCATGLVAWDDCAAGTAGYEKRMSIQTADADRCAGYGFKPGTDGYSQCRMQLDQNHAAANNALLGAALATRPAPMTAYQVPLPVTTNCITNGSFTNCSSR